MIIHLMPSEIARLVLGYLRETDCKETAKLLVKESKYLTEYANGLKNGINYSTNIGGKSLLDIINAYCCQQNKDIENQSKVLSNEQQLAEVSKQLSKVETLLNKFMQNSNNFQTNNQNNYRLIGSPPIISTSSPLFINTIGMNSTPFSTNQTSKVAQNKTCLPNTPLRSEYNSPRRKRTPRRRVLSGSSPFKQSLNTSLDDSSDHTLVNTSASDQLRDESEPQLKIDINEPLVQPEFIVEELINFEPLHDVLADNINKIFNTNCNENDDQNNEIDKQCNNESKTDEQNFESIEIRINDEVVNSILSNLESAPEFNAILDIITEKELQMTPYKNLTSVDSGTSSSASSLNTPQTPQLRVMSQKTAIDNANSVVKNLMTDLKTPEKTVTLYAAHSPSNARITPVKVTPVKVFRTDLTQDFNFVINDKSLPIIVPKVSLIGQDFDYINTIVNNGNTYSVSVQSNTNQNSQQLVGSVGSVRKPKGKNVDFSKPAAELQVKRSDLIPRKILPKPSNSGHISTTTIIPVCSNVVNESVPNQPLILVNNPNGVQIDPQIDSNSQSPKRVQTKDRNGKRPNSTPTESSPVKIRASDIRFPTVNILRKMNVNKMDQFLKQIHSSAKNTD